MKIRKSLLAAACAGIAVLGFIPLIHADEWNKRTLVTVNEPIIAGNKVLQPGTYVWKLQDSQSNRNVVQIFNSDGSKLETTVMAIPNYRLQPTGKTQFSFWETPAGVPKAVRAWFYPGDNYGQEFTFPKKLVAQLASAQPVPIPASYNPPPEASPEPAPAPQPEPAAAPEPAPTPTPAPAATPAPAPQATPAPAVTEEPKTLPKTASYGPLIGLAGLFSLGFFGVLSLATKKS
jgi:outer membrane biosynthesis protein TonB